MYDSDTCLPVEIDSVEPVCLHKRLERVDELCSICGARGHVTESPLSVGVIAWVLH
jgi:hypothetical protein